MKYDLAIIGGGISGLALSIDMAKRGYKIMVIEKGNYPRHKVCGEYISMESHAYLFNICPSLSDMDLPLVTDFKLTSGKNKLFTTTLGLGGFGISRYLLEELLFKEAKKNGVTFLLNTKAQDVNQENNHQYYSIKTQPENVKALLVCNATGRKSNIRTTEILKNATQTNYVGVKYHVKLKRRSDLIEIHNFPGGYCGISSIEDGKSCLCYIVNSKRLNTVNNSITELEKKFLFENNCLKEIFTDAEFIFEEPITVSGIHFNIKQPVANHQFFIGDAAGSIAPITGNGMSIGMRSAFVLAVNLDLYFSQKITRQQLIANYSLFWRKSFSTRIKLSRSFQKLSEYPFLTKNTIAIFNIFPSLAQVVIKQTHGTPFANNV